MLSIVYVQLQCHGYGLQITVNGPLRALLTSDPRQGHEETGGLIASDCFIQLIPFHSAYLFLLFSFFCATGTGLQSRHGAARQLESVLDWSDWRTRSDRFTIGAEATNKMFAVTWLEYNKMYCPPAPVREDKRRSVSSGMDFRANWISKHVFKQETRPGVKDHGRRLPHGLIRTLSLCSMDFTASEIPPDDLTQMLFGTSVYAEKMVIVAS